MEVPLPTSVDLIYLSDEENWKNKNPRANVATKSRRSMQSMLNPSFKVGESIFLLKNGHLSVNQQYSVYTCNTCPFDSIFASIAALYADYEVIKFQINNSAPESEFLKMVTLMFKGAEKSFIKLRSLLRNRNDVLLSVFKDSKEATKFENGLYIIDCAANINYLIPKILPVSLYSYSRMKICENCNEKIVSNRCFVDIDMVQYEQRSIEHLNSCLLDTLVSEKSSTCACGGSLKLYHTYFNNFIIIDLHLKHSIKEISLKDIPKTLNLLGNEFTLTACLEYIPFSSILIDSKKIKMLLVITLHTSIAIIAGRDSMTRKQKLHYQM